MVRALKRLQSDLLEKNLVRVELASYFVECLVYNVPDVAFGHATYQADMREVLAAIFNATLSDGNWREWVEVNELKYLYLGGEESKVGVVRHFADVAWNRLGFG